MKAMVFYNVGFTTEISLYTSHGRYEAIRPCRAVGINRYGKIFRRKNVAISWASANAATPITKPGGCGEADAHDCDRRVEVLV